MFYWVRRRVVPSRWWHWPARSMVGRARLRDAGRHQIALAGGAGAPAGFSRRNSGKERAARSLLDEILGQVVVPR